MDVVALDNFFQSVYSSRRYSDFLNTRLGAGAVKYVSFLDAWYGLCDEVRPLLRGEPLPTMWDGATKTATIYPIPAVLTKLDEGYILLGFASLTEDQVVRVATLPIFVGEEIAIVCEVIHTADIWARSSAAARA